MGEYIVYKHTTPNEKVYIGITKRKPEERWQEGRGYKCNHHFTNAIRKYGWDNIEHEIICKGLNENDAKQMLAKLVKAGEVHATPDRQEFIPAEGNQKENTIFLNLARS